MNLDHLTRDDFRQWLAAHEPDEVVGFASSPVGCPCRNYLAARLLDDRAMLCLGTLTIMNTGFEHEKYLTPAWMREVEEAFLADEQVHFDRGEKGPFPLTAKRALTILDSAEAHDMRPTSREERGD